MKYGPQTEEIEQVVKKVRTLTPEKVKSLGIAWTATWDVAWDAARDDAWDAAWDAARDDAWDDAWEAVDAASEAVDAVRDAAWNAARDAVLALLVKDKISSKHFNTLYGPWKSVMG